MKTELTMVIAGLTTPPASPLKGRAHRRIEWPYRNAGLARAAFDAVPVAHKDTLAVRSRKGGFYSSSRVISPEAAHALKEIAALLDAKHQMAALEKQVEAATKAAADKAKQAATLAALSDSGAELFTAWKAAGCPHPAPEAVYALKAASGLGWKAFQSA